MAQKATRSTARQLEDANWNKQDAEYERQERRAEPKQCSQCHRIARTRCKTCRVCYEKGKVNKSSFVICQGCPQINSKPNRIRWSPQDTVSATWLENELELKEVGSSKNTSSKWLQVVSWKGQTESTKTLDGISLYSC